MKPTFRLSPGKIEIVMPDGERSEVWPNGPAFDRPASLDAAWAEAEAAVPEGWFGPAVEPRWPDRWRAWVYKPWPSPVEPRSVFGESEAEALRALAEELAAHAGSIAECSRIE